MSRERAFELIRDAMVSLPQDLKAMLRVAEDVEIPDEGRIAAAGALLHWMSATNGIPGARGLLAYVDDVIIIRMVLAQLKVLAPEAIAKQAEVAGPLISEVDEWVATVSDYLGGSVKVLERAMSDSGKLKYKGHTPEECVRSEASGTWLYEEVQAELVSLELAEDQVTREVRGLEAIIKPLRDRLR
jgi:hypothetical protein